MFAFISMFILCGHRVVGISNGHSIHAGPYGTGVSIYLSIYLHIVKSELVFM